MALELAAFVLFSFFACPKASGSTTLLLMAKWIEGGQWLSGGDQTPFMNKATVYQYNTDFVIT
jgi:hypothetical protein